MVFGKHAVATSVLLVQKCSGLDRLRPISKGDSSLHTAAPAMRSATDVAACHQKHYDEKSRMDTDRYIYIYVCIQRCPLVYHACVRFTYVCAFAVALSLQSFRF